MKPSRWFGSLSAAAIVLSAGATAWAADETYQTKNSGDWGNYANPYTWQVFRNNAWVDVTSAADIPNAGDTATILSTHAVTASNSQSIMSLTINTGGDLLIDGTAGTPAVLDFSGSGTTVLSIADADAVQLVDNATLKVSKTMSVSGAGSIQGLDNAVVIALNPDNSTAVTLTVSAAVHGKLVFKKDAGAGSAAADLINDKEFRADVSGNFTLDSSLTSIDDTPSSDGCSAPRWAVDTASANLIFNKSATTLNGGFFIDNGTLQVNQTIQTDAVDGSTNSGFLKFMSGGAINVAAGKQFRFSGNCDGATCTPTPGALTGNNSCS